MKLINPKNKLFRWGPIDGRLIYPDFWGSGMYDFSKEYKPGWPAMICLFRKDRFFLVVDYKNLYNNGEKIFKKYLLNNKNFRLNYRKWENMIVDFEKTLKLIKKQDIKKLDNKEFAKLTLLWRETYGNNFWNIGSLPEISNWGGEQLLIKKLKKKLKNEEDFNFVMERLTAPEDFSFYQKEELELLSLKKINNVQTLKRKLLNHQAKYFWLSNSYHNTKILPISYFEKVLNYFSKNKAKSKISEIKKLRISAIKDKIKIIKKYKLSADILKISQRLAFSIWWQDARKAYIFQANHAIDIILQEVAIRFNINFDDLHYYSAGEIESLILKNNKIEDSEIKKRKNNLVVVYGPFKNHKYFSGREAEKIFAPYLNTKVTKNIKEIKGTVVNGGKIKGMIRVIHSTKEIKKMKKGDILVASMTSPEFIIALRKAAAVVTDEGGMTCHAAIVSRELKIPGIVGTKIATQILKDGDLAEVDADKGIVRIIKR